MRKVPIFLLVFFACIIPRWYLLPYLGLHLFHMRISIYCMLLLAILFIYLIRKKSRIKIKKEQVKDIGVFFVWFLISVFLLFKSEDFANSMTEIYYIGLGLLSVLVMNFVIKDFESVKVCFGGVFFATILHLVIGYYEVIRKIHFFATGINDTMTGGRPVSIFYNNNDYGTFIIVMLPIAIAFLQLSLKGFWSKLLSIILAVIGIYIVLFAQSDTILIAVIMVILAIIGIYISRKYNKLLQIIIMLLFVSLAIGIVFITAKSIETMISNILYNEQCRVNLIKNGLYFLRKSWGLGIGYGNTQYYLQNYSIYDVFNVYYFHNWYFEILFCGGIITFVLYICFQVRKIKELFILSKRSGELNLTYLKEKSYDPVSMLVLVSFLIFSAVCISSSSNLYSEWMWMYFGLISAYVNLLFNKGVK